MDPQSWLDAFVRRNLKDLARVRGYAELSLATAMKTERQRRPHPRKVEGAVIATNVRDLILLSAENPLFASGNFELKPRPNRAVRLIEKATGQEIAVRKIAPAEKVVLTDLPAGVYPVQDGMFEASGGFLPQGLLPVLVWSINRHDLLGEFRAVIVDGERVLGRTPLVVCASTEIPPLEGVLTPNVPAPSAPGDDFGTMVQSRKGREDDAEGLGGPTSGA
ncbi:hypothetical protein ACFVSX_16280 [Streptomyces rubiginosohelvolus]|uniref:hypothetical protein n=1 Tax=Streptomyces rubiginosohelvolus TaxID=67362 RepID=UPI0036D92F2D